MADNRGAQERTNDRRLQYLKRQLDRGHQLSREDSRWLIEWVEHLLKEVDYLVTGEDKS